MESHFSLEVQAGFEPADNGVADRGLTTWLLHQRFSYSNIITKFFRFVNRKREKLLKRFYFFKKREHSGVSWVMCIQIIFTFNGRLAFVTELIFGLTYLLKCGILCAVEMLQYYNER